MPEKKYKKITKLISVTMCLLFFLSFSASVYSQDDEASVINREVKMINEDISDKKNQVKKIQDKQAEYEALIKQKQQEKSSLNNQLSLLDNRLAKSELDIELVETEIGRIELEIQKTNLEIESRNKDILKNKDQIPKFIIRFSMTGARFQRQGWSNTGKKKF